MNPTVVLWVMRLWGHAEDMYEKICKEFNLPKAEKEDWIYETLKETIETMLKLNEITNEEYEEALEFLEKYKKKEV